MDRTLLRGALLLLTDVLLLALQTAELRLCHNQPVPEGDAITTTSDRALAPILPVRSLAVNRALERVASPCGALRAAFLAAVRRFVPHRPFPHLSTSSFSFYLPRIADRRT
jgi:hypothetical protein